jgi:hypothetical protein
MAVLTEHVVCFEVKPGPKKVRIIVGGGADDNFGLKIVTQAMPDRLPCWRARLTKSGFAKDDAK